VTGRNAETELRAMAEFLDSDLALEIYRLYDVDDALEVAKVEISNLRRDLHRATVIAGELRHQVATAAARLAELCPPEIIKARHDAFFKGAGFFKVVSLGRHQYATEHIPTEKVTIRAD
jgi:hypothetical protein